MERGLTFDTGALIALESRRPLLRKRWLLALAQRRIITAPTVVIAEWWRGRSDLRDEIVASLRVEPLSETIAKVAGQALAAVGGSSTVDAIVMASAAQRGDVVYTSDYDDLERLRAYFPSVRVLAV